MHTQPVLMGLGLSEFMFTVMVWLLAIQLMPGLTLVVDSKDWPSLCGKMHPCGSHYVIRGPGRAVSVKKSCFVMAVLIFHSLANKKMWMISSSQNQGLSRKVSPRIHWGTRESCCLLKAFLGCSLSSSRSSTTASVNLAAILNKAGHMPVHYRGKIILIFFSLSLPHTTLLGFWNVLLSTLFNLNLNRTSHHFPREKQQWRRWEREELHRGNAPYHLANLFLFINLLHGTVSLMALTLKWKRSPQSILTKNAIMTLGWSRTRISFCILNYFQDFNLSLQIYHFTLAKINYHHKKPCIIKIRTVSYIY